MFVIDDLQTMRGLTAPRPEHQVAIVRRSTRGKARYDQTGATGGDQPIGKLPGGNQLVISRKPFPGAAQLRRSHLCCITNAGVSQIENMFELGAVAADREWLRLEGETLLGLEPGGFEAERRIEARRADAVEAAAVKLRAFAGFRIISPRRMMRPIDQAVEPGERQG